MKKLFTLSLCLLCVIALVACDSIFKEEHQHTYDYICNEDTHQKVYTCGCFSPDISELHINYDADLFCDICGYFIDPERVSKPLSSEEEWLNAVTAEDITQIRSVHYGSFLGTGRLKEIFTVTDKEDIEKILECYQTLNISSLRMHYEVTDEHYEVQFAFADGETKKITVHGGFLYKQYGISNLPKLNNYESASLSFCFWTQAETGRVIEYQNGDAEVLHTVCHIPMDELEFVFVPSGATDRITFYSDSPPLSYRYDVRTEFGILDFQSNDLFTVSGESGFSLLYRLVGKNLDQLIAEYAPQAE